MVIRLSSMGDVAMTVPVLRCLLAQHPNLRLTVVSRPFFAHLFADLPNTDFFGVDVDGDYKGLLGLWRLAKRLAAVKPDVIADLHDVLRSQVLRRILSFVYAIPCKVIDKGRGEKRQLCARRPNKKLIQLKSTHQRYADVFEQLGYVVDLQQNISTPTLTLSEAASAFLPNNDLPKIGIAPFARYVGKTYPAQKMRAFLDLMKDAYPNANLYFFGGEADKALLAEWAALSPNWRNVAGVLNLQDELALIQGLDLMLSMDSANMHLASMLEVPVISLWGATHPCLGFYGWGQDPKNALLADINKYPTLPCSVNGKKLHPNTADCMESIEPSAILELMKRLLN
jgi:ADP-heptose:LPS heptosyltransferase